MYVSATRRGAVAHCPLTKTLFAALALTACGETSTQPQPFARPDVSVLAQAQLVHVSGNHQEGVVGTQLAEPLVVLVVDAGGNPVPGAPVTWNFGSGRRSGSSASPAVTRIELTADAEGRSSVEWELGTVAGSQGAWAQIASPPAGATADDGPAPELDRVAGFGATASPSEGVEIIVSQTSVEIEEGETLALTAVVVDRFGNVSPDAGIVWTSSDTSVATVSNEAQSSPTISLAALPAEVAPVASPAADSDLTDE